MHSSTRVTIQHAGEGSHEIAPLGSARASPTTLPDVEMSLFPPLALQAAIGKHTEASEDNGRTNYRGSRIG